MGSSSTEFLDPLYSIPKEEDGTKAAEQVIPFDKRDLQKTDENTRRGFRFVLHNEPFEQYLRDHPDVTPSKRSLMSKV